MSYSIDTPEGMQRAVSWTEAHLRCIREGGIWFVPRTCSTYVVSHKDKTLVRSGLFPDPSISKVVAEMGWKVIEKELP